MFLFEWLPYVDELHRTASSLIRISEQKLDSAGSQDTDDKFFLWMSHWITARQIMAKFLQKILVFMNKKLNFIHVQISSKI
jgi:hypothetical protein